jgi:hypothetical protein
MPKTDNNVETGKITSKRGKNEPITAKLEIRGAGRVALGSKARGEIKTPTIAKTIVIKKYVTIRN